MYSSKSPVPILSISRATMLSLPRIAIITDTKSTIAKMKKKITIFPLMRTSLMTAKKATNLMDSTIRGSRKLDWMILSHLN